MTFSEIDTLRLQAGISQRAICRAAGVWPQSYTKWLAGHGITARNLERLITALRKLSEPGNHDED